MKLLPTEAGARRRLLLMTVTVVVLGWLYYQFGGGPTYVIPQTTGPAATSKLPVTGRNAGARTAKQGPVPPQKLHLKEMEYVPEEPEAGRDPFRFGVRPTPKPTPTPTLPYTPPPVFTPPPPPPPKVPLFLTTTVVDPDGKRRAYLHDKNGTTFEGVEGQKGIDGRYNLIKVDENAVVMTFIDGTGQTVIYRGG
jgi:hypothetical protein